MEALKSGDIFKPASFPKYTYVSRKLNQPNLKTSVDYEKRLEQALKISGILVSIVGPSKMGKTVLCEKVIDFSKIVELSGADFNCEEQDFWQVVGAKVGLPLQGASVDTDTLQSEKRQKERTISESYFLHKDQVISYFKEHQLVLVLDDFHYANEQMQVRIAQLLKDAIRKEFKAIIISLPHRADDAIRKNADLSGRLNLINIESWSPKELEKIVMKGFQQLNISVPNVIAEKISIESLTSPQLTQYICLSICTLLDIDTEQIHTISEDILEDAYRFTTTNFDYRDVVHVLKTGPNTRGKQRKIFSSKYGALDIYGLIIQAIIQNPPLVKLSLDELKMRIDYLIDKEIKKPDKQTIRDALNKLQTILDEKEDIYKVFEWKDQALYILDPLFLFYLRWGMY